MADKRSRDEVLGPPLGRVFERSSVGPFPPNPLVLRAAAAAFGILSIQLVHCGSRVRTGESAADASTEVQPPACGPSGSSCASNDAGVPTCDSGWACAVDESCSTPTTLTGKVLDPAGLNPLYNAIVFVPSAISLLPTFTPGTSGCACSAPLGDYVAATTTDPTGTFTLLNVPTGRAVPVTVQTGKWRRTVFVNIAANCATNTVPDGMLRLPRSRSEGDLPQMAVLTGGADDLGCFLLRVGIDASEYSAPHASGRVDVYRGVAASSGVATDAGPGLSVGTAGDCTTASCPLWASKWALEYYDTVLLSCEGDPYTASKPASAIQAMHDWMNEGGRVFAMHSQSLWFQSGPSDFQGVAAWKDFSPALAAGVYSINSTFPNGKWFDQWLDDLGAATNASIALSPVSDTVGSAVDAATRWIDDPSSADAGVDAASTGDVKLLSFATPLGGINDAGPAYVTMYCGKAVFSDIHIGAAPSGDLPTSCPTGPLTAEEKALEFLLFDQALCVPPTTVPHP
jgi:hypothetical protein